MSSDKTILAVVFSESDLLNKIEDLKSAGYKEQDLHIMAKDIEHFENYAFDKKEVDTFTDKFKGFVSGESGVREGVKSLGLSESETERYTADLAKGGILLYQDEQDKTILDKISGNEIDAEQENPNDQQRQQFINSVDNNFDEQEDRFARGETFAQNPTIVQDERHNSFTTQENPEVEKARGGSSETEKHSQNDKKYK
ncbi:general stress protein [Planococcus sp. ISL-110]|uniref:general stress protein n=1 Tax=Planococcus sp. ISL-110 TaxID=2819167 RepID=UPI001BE75EC7|nr:general stress protein [Planococcus sp. ISL-110]MBT2570461.1 general stress protein [Planococcus sp. ISL-110]